MPTIKILEVASTRKGEREAVSILHSVVGSRVEFAGKKANERIQIAQTCVHICGPLLHMLASKLFCHVDCTAEFMWMLRVLFRVLILL